MSDGHHSLMCGVFFIMGTLVGAGLEALRSGDRTACVELGQVTSREVIETQVGLIQREWTRPKCFDRPAAASGGAHE